MFVTEWNMMVTIISNDNDNENDNENDNDNDNNNINNNNDNDNNNNKNDNNDNNNNNNNNNNDNNNNNNNNDNNDKNLRLIMSHGPGTMITMEYMDNMYVHYQWHLLVIDLIFFNYHKYHSLTCSKYFLKKTYFDHSCHLITSWVNMPLSMQRGTH